MVISSIEESKPTHIEFVAIDADVVAYRSSAATEGKPFYECQDAIDTLMSYIIGETVVFQTGGNVKGYLTGHKNFRYNVAKTYPYKGNRKDKVKPTHLSCARDYMMSEYNCTITQGLEADDCIAMDIVAKGSPEYTAIASNDKDFKTVPGWLFNFTKTGEGKWTYSDYHTSLLYFYEQILTGDSADNIKGLFGVGPKKAQAILEGALTEGEMFARVLKAYKEKCKDGDPLERIVENGRLLYLLRDRNQVWGVPK